MSKTTPVFTGRVGRPCCLGCLQVEINYDVIVNKVSHGEMICPPMAVRRGHIDSAAT